MFIREEMKEHPEISVEEETIQKDLWDIEKQIKNIGHQVGEDISVMKSPIIKILNNKLNRGVE